MEAYTHFNPSGAEEAEINSSSKTVEVDELSSLKVLWNIKLQNAFEQSN